MQKRRPPVWSAFPESTSAAARHGGNLKPAPRVKGLGLFNGKMGGGFRGAVLLCSVAGSLPRTVFVIAQSPGVQNESPLCLPEPGGEGVPSLGLRAPIGFREAAGDTGQGPVASLSCSWEVLGRGLPTCLSSCSAVCLLRWLPGWACAPACAPLSSRLALRPEGMFIIIVGLIELCDFPLSLKTS